MLLIYIEDHQPPLDSFCGILVHHERNNVDETRSETHEINTTEEAKSNIDVKSKPSGYSDIELLKRMLDSSKTPEDILYILFWLTLVHIKNYLFKLVSGTVK